MHFKDFDLLDTYVLDPKWVTQGVYKIINSKDLAKNKGILKLYVVDTILERKNENDFLFPSDLHRFLINLMKKFGLCYKIDSETILIPDLLEKKEPKTDFFNFDTALRFLIDYDEFLPKSIMPRFIVKMRKNIKDNLQWRTGVVLENKTFNSTAVIKADEKARKIFIYVTGDQKRDYLSAIRYAFLDINSSFEKLEAIEKIPLPDNPKVTPSYDHIVTLEQMGFKKFVPDGSKKTYNVEKLLGIVYVRNYFEEEILNLLRKIADKTQHIENNNEKILQLLQKLANQSENEGEFEQKLKNVFEIKPEFFGISFDLKKLYKLIRKGDFKELFYKLIEKL